MPIRAHSLIELAVAMVISLLLLTIAIPLIDGPIQDSAFHRFSAELTGNLVAARRYAQLSGSKVIVEFDCDAQTHYRCRIDPSQSGEAHNLFVHTHDPDSRIDLQLPDEPVTHPTTGSQLSDALRSSQGDRVIFTRSGASAATITYSDAEDRACCIVISPLTGRIRSYLWDADQRQWLVFF